MKNVHGYPDVQFKMFVFFHLFIFLNYMFSSTVISRIEFLFCRFWVVLTE